MTPETAELVRYRLGRATEALAEAALLLGHDHVMGDGHEFMRFSELGGGPPLIAGRARRAIARPARRTGSPDPHDPGKALRRSRARADKRGAVSRGFRGAQHSTWRLLYTPVKEERNFICSWPSPITRLAGGMPVALASLLGLW